MDMAFASKMVDLALSRGADEAEVYARRSRNLGIEIKDQKLDALESSVTAGYGIRVIKDKQPGFSYSTNPDDMSRVVNIALSVARYAERDENLGLPLSLIPGKVSVFDERIAALTESDAADCVMLLEKSALDTDRRINKIRKAAGSFGTSDTCIVNSKGIRAFYSSSGCSAHITVIAEQGPESQTGWDYEGSRFFNEVNFKRVGVNAAKKALQLLGAKKIRPMKGFILLDSSVASEFLGIFASALSSESVQKGKSMLAGKKGEQVLSPLLNITDNGLLDGKPGSKPFDGEGVPARSKVLVEKGVLKGFLYNTYTARREGIESTGNASRGGPSGLPGVGPTNLYIEPFLPGDSREFGKLLGAIDKGLYVTEAMGMHTVNPVSGEYSIGISGLLIEKGETVHPVKEAIISGNMLDLFRQVIMVGDDLRFYGNIGVASLLIEAIDISG